MHLKRIILNPNKENPVRLLVIKKWWEDPEVEK